VPSGYIHRPEPPTINPMIMNRLDEIELRMRNGFLNQLPGVLGNHNEKDEADSVSSLVQNPGKGSEDDFDNQIPENLNDSSGAASSTSAAASSSDEGIAWQGVRVYVSPTGTLKYKSNRAGEPKDGYISKFISKNKARIAALNQLYSDLEAKNIRFNKNFTIDS
jgi:hypothetical protein